jgi:cyclopropane-fatty-acyl-phospholipid synthase
MLDSSMTYTCGYWHGVTKLEDAQRQKLDLVCRKLRLEKGMRIFDIGCGWGNFAQYAASEYGAVVTGVTISKEQAALARHRCRDLPVEIVLGDYRTVSGSFDRIVSIEMIEAVGKKNLDTFFAHVFNRLEPGGLFLLQAISAETVSPYSRRRLDEFLIWILTYIFPNGYLPTITELVKPGRMQGVVEDIHNFGPDYELTLLSWAVNFERAWPSLRTGYDEQFYRMWQFYLYSCAALFRARITQVYQIVYAKPHSGSGTYRFVR